MPTWKGTLFSEPLEPPELTPEQAFEAGRRGDLSGYEAAGRKCARLLYGAAKSNGQVGRVLGSIKRVSLTLNRYAGSLGESDKHVLWQDWFMDLISYLRYVLEKECPDIQREIDQVGPTGFMWGWAVQAAAGALEEDGYFNSYGFPRRGKR